MIITRDPRMAGMGECGYLDLLSCIMEKGEQKMERNGMTRKVVGPTLSFDLLNDPFPLFVSKQVYWKGIIGELDFFINGVTDIRWLWRRNIHIWDDDWAKFAVNVKKVPFWKVETMLAKGKLFHNAVVEHAVYGALLDANEHAMFDMGKIYGYQWRGQNAYGVFGMDAPLITGFGRTDQFRNMIDSVNKGGSRRDIVDSWTPLDMDDMALPPCHVLMQVHRNGDFLDMTMYQRSADMFLGVPFNITSYAVLLRLIAFITNTKARNLTLMFGDAHIYEAHFDAVKEQLSRYDEVVKRYRDYSMGDIMANVPRLKISISDTDLIGDRLGRLMDKHPEKNKYRMMYEKHTIDLEIVDYDPLDKISAPLLT